MNIIIIMLAKTLFTLANLSNYPQKSRWETPLYLLSLVVMRMGRLHNALSLPLSFSSKHVTTYHPPSPYEILNLELHTSLLFQCAFRGQSLFAEQMRLTVPAFPPLPSLSQEISEPSIATAFARCVDRGARTIIISPYFLSPGRHWSQVGSNPDRPFPVTQRLEVSGKEEKGQDCRDDPFF